MPENKKITLTIEVPIFWYKLFQNTLFMMFIGGAFGLTLPLFLFALMDVFEKSDFSWHGWLRVFWGLVMFILVISLASLAGPVMGQIYKQKNQSKS